MKLTNPQDDLLCRVLAGPMTAELAQELEAWLEQDPAQREIFAQFLLLEDMLFAVRKELSASHILSLLLEMEEAAEPLELVKLPQDQIHNKNRHSKKSLGPRHSLAIAGYLVATGLRTRAGAIAATAAVLLLAAVLAISLIGPRQTTQGPDLTAQAPATTQPSTPSSAPIVASITGEHEAHWAIHTFARGAELRAGQRLELTAGFAEITTASGAVAVLEAPATIEMIDSPNALRLHAGKLVGICETESSKGFVVKTKHADITDIGTEFGVAAEQADTTVSVLSGQVLLQSLLQADQPLLLHKNDAASVDRQGARWIENTQQINQLFAQLLNQARFRQLRAQGQIKLLAQAPTSIARGKSIDLEHLQLFCEQRDVVLNESLAVDVTQTGLINSNEYEIDAVMLADKTVDSYLLFASRTSDLPSWKADITRLKATITFEHAIVALIGRTQSLEGSDAILGLNEVDYERNANRGLFNEDNRLLEDFIEISEDRKTLTIDCKVLGQDQLRILIESP